MLCLCLLRYVRVPAVRIRYKRRFIYLLLSVVLLCFSSIPASAEQPLDWYDTLLLLLSDGDPAAWVADTLPEEAGRGSEWYVIALSQSGDEYDFTSYAAALAAYLSETDVPGAVARQRYALALLAVGAESDYPMRTAVDSIGQQGIMSWVFGLHLLHNGVTDAAYTEQEILEKLLELQLEDGGWAVSGQQADVDVTAMVLQALADCEESCAAAIEAGVSLLSARQLSDGGFQSYGTANSESISQVIIALTSLGIDPLKDKRFWKDGVTVLDALGCFRLADGSFCHVIGGERNETATIQAFLALTALRRQARGAGGLYHLDAVSEPEPSDIFSDAPSAVLTTDPERISSADSARERGFSTGRWIALFTAILCALLGAGSLLAAGRRSTK